MGFFRLLLLFIVLFILWKLIKIFFLQRPRFGSPRERENPLDQSSTPFSNIQDAEFEDLSSKADTDSEKPKQDS
ncbi:MAG: hypothetical protein HY707_01940 [Ignavibacteriae bacterium]|nr:hypothetical protein [Ignavibacteriota bacterium]